MSESEAKQVPPNVVWRLGAVFLVAFFLLLWCAFQAWPRPSADGSWENAWGARGEVVLFTLVIVSSGLGSFVHLATSFSTFVGNRRFVGSWVGWYLFRIPIGISLAIVFYAVFRAGFLSANASLTDVNPYGFAAIAGLVGLFSKQATDKLREIFDALFNSEEADLHREDKLATSVPTILAIEPVVIPAGKAVDLIIRGQGFTESSFALLGDQKMPVEYVSPSELKLALSAKNVKKPGTPSLRVVTAMHESLPVVLPIQSES